MSLGLGRVQLAVLAAFRSEPRGIFTTKELCQRAYNVTEPEKRHRVAVIRAIATLRKRRILTIGQRAERHDDIWFDRNEWPI